MRPDDDPRRPARSKRTVFAPAVRRLAREHRRRLVVVSALALVASLAEAAALCVLVVLATTVATSNGDVAIELPGIAGLDRLGVGALVGVGVGFVVLRTVAQVVASYVTTRMTSRAEADAKSRLLHAYLGAEWPEQAAQLSGSFQALVLADAETLRTTLEYVARLLMALASFTMMLAVAVSVSAGTALVMIVTAIVLGAIVRPMARTVRSSATTLVASRAEIADQVGQALQLGREIHVYGVGDRVAGGIDALLDRCRRLRVRIEIANHAVSTLYQSMVLLASVGGLGVIYAIDPSLLTTVGPVVLLLLRSLSYSQAMQQSVHLLETLGPSVERLEVETVALEQAKVSDAGTDVETVELVELRDVTYSYVPGHSVLDGISLTVARGDIVGLVGPSGGGKSTIVQLLLRLRTPDTGAMLVNGVPADRLRLTSWHRHIAYVPQEPLLLDATIAENIRFHRSGITDEQLVRAAQRAGIHDEVERLALGYDEVAGEGGRRLSGGQRQRICLARALVGEPDLLVVDEPTSSLDAHSEHAVRTALGALRGEVAVIIVAHRLSTLDVCDRVLVLRDGAVEAEGTLTELAATSAYFRSISTLAGATGPT